MDAMSIGQVARRAGIRPSTLRYYEQIGLLPAPQRISGRRHYDAGALQRLAIIQTAQHAGFTLDEIRLLFDEILENPSAKATWQTLIQQKLHELNMLMFNVQRMKSLLEKIMECDDAQLEDCIYRTGQKHDALRQV